MSKYDFDTVINRYNTNCLKYDYAERRGYPKDILPLWVADMDFKTAPQILEALHKAVDHGIFGYSNPREDYNKAVAEWFSKRFGWSPESNWLVNTPGVVFALSMAVRSFTDKGDKVLIQPPVYYPFYSVVEDNDRKLVENELLCINGRYEIDFDDFENKIKTENVKLFILCSPHNPVGRVWTNEELRRIGEICGRYNVIVVSDEIHCDFVYGGYEHKVFTKACPELQNRAVICTAPSKSFNIAGLQVSNIWIADKELRHKFKKEIVSCGYTEMNALGLVAAKAAYESGGDWLDECWDYIGQNLDFMREFFQKNIPQIKLVEPEGTYFAWLDCSELGLDKKQLNELIINKAGLWLDAGHIFGKRSEMFQRVVLACPRETLQLALDKLYKAINFDD